MNAPLVSIFVLGLPQPAGSKKAFPIYKGSGPDRRFTGHVSVVDDNSKAGPWKTQIGWEARRQYAGPLLSCPLAVEIIFELPRPAGHAGARGNLLPSKPAFPGTKPDVLKLARAVEDALTSILWVDDALIVTERIEKRYGDRPSCRVNVWTLAASVAELLGSSADARLEALPLFGESA